MVAFVKSFLANKLSRRLSVSQSVAEIARSLLLVENGDSERSSVERIVSNSSVKPLVLEAVLAIVSEKDSIDRDLQNLLGLKPSKSQDWMYLRAGYYALRRSLVRTKADSRISIIRSNTPIDLLNDIERMIGAILSKDYQEQKEGFATDEQKIAFRTHNQVWWVKYCLRLFSRSEAIQFLSHPTRPRFVHVNSIRNGGKLDLPPDPNIRKRLHATAFPRIFQMTSSPSNLSEYFARGLFQIQDLASFATIVAANPSPGENVLDVCAATGSKTCSMAQLMMNTGRILSVDISFARFRAWRNQVDRLGVKIAEPLVMDARNMSIQDRFDLVLVDPPCTGSGIFDRNPQMKWHISPESLRLYGNIQQQILSNASMFVGPNGRLVYSTCSITLEENEQVVSDFIKSNPQFEIRPIGQDFGSPGLRGLTDARRFYPHRDSTAGYFVARLERSS